MATTSSTAKKTKPDNQNLTRSRSLGLKPKPSPSLSEPEAKTNRKPIEKKPIISSRPDPVKFLKKNNALEGNQKLPRRRSFDRPSSSLTSSSSSSSQKSLRPVFVPKEKPVTGGLRSSTSFHGSSRVGLKGSCAVKSPPPVASRRSPGAKRSSLSGSISLKTRKEVTGNASKKFSGKEITPKSSPLAPAHENADAVVKVETDVRGSDHREETKDQVVQLDESMEEKETGQEDASTEEEKGEVINEDKTGEPANAEDKEEVEKKVDDEENSGTDMKEAAQVKEDESESSKAEEGTSQVEELPEEETKKEVVLGKKESPTAYNDIIASKLQENSKKNNKVLALAGAFQTVIDYETSAASK